MSGIIVEHTRIAIRGGHLFVRTWLPQPTRTSVPLILVHDSLGCVELWREFPEALARRLQVPVIAYDRLGFGQSSPRLEPPSMNFIHEEAETVLPLLLHAVSISDFMVFGHSVGGAMALAMAAVFGERCKAVISESAQAFVEHRTLEGVRAAQITFSQPEQFAKLTRWHGDKAAWVLSAWTDTWLSPAFAHWNLDSVLGAVRCPVLVLHGDSDEYGSVAFPERIAWGIQGPSECVILNGCGHVPHRERRDEVLGLIEHVLCSLVLAEP